jgi:hypothetical protein
MMTEWMKRTDEVPEANKLYDFIWNFTHKWNRWIFDDRNEKVTALLISLWARLCFMCPDNYANMALEALDELDSLKHQIICLKVLRQNLRQEALDAELPLVIQEKIYSLFIEAFAVEKQLVSEENEITWFTNSILELAPNINGA